MSIETPEDRAGMEAAGRATRAVLNAMKNTARAGVTTRELDDIGLYTMNRLGARSAPRLVYGFPGQSCISVNDEIVHGVPADRTLRDSDLVKLDVTVELNGYMADACESVIVGSATSPGRLLVDCARRAFEAGMAIVRPGARAFDIGRAVNKVVRQAGFFVIRELTGHGIGRTIHERPIIPNYYEPQCSDLLTEGLVFTIEPIIAMGTHRTVALKDGWTIRTRDRSLAAHHEHTVVVTADGARILTT